MYVVWVQIKSSSLPLSSQSSSQCVSKIPQVHNPDCPFMCYCQNVKFWQESSFDSLSVCCLPNVHFGKYACLRVCYLPKFLCNFARMFVWWFVCPLVSLSVTSSIQVTVFLYVYTILEWYMYPSHVTIHEFQNVWDRFILTSDMKRS